MIISKGLLDIDELILRCRSESAKDYISEAVACYKIGAYRQCIVATWIAVVYDYIDKLRELELTGDKNAKQQLDAYISIQLQNDISRSINFERNFLNVARDEFQLISELEHKDLTRLQEDRNRCAHPSMNSPEEIYRPSPELARSHLRNSVEYLLQHPPLQGKAALDRLFKDIKSEYFPTDEKSAIKYFSSGPLVRPRESLVRNLVTVITKCLLLEDLDWGSPQNHRYIAALNAVRYIHPEISSNTLASTLSNIMQRTVDENLVRCLLFLDYVPDSWQYLQDDVKLRLNNYVRDIPDEDILDGLASTLNIDELYDLGIDKLHQLDDDMLAFLLDFDNRYHRIEVFNRSIDLYISSGSFDQANSRGRNLIIPISDQLEPHHVERIIRGAHENSQILDSFERSSVFNAIQQANIISHDEFDALLMRYGFIDKNQEDMDDDNWEDIE